jgi:hypothetical protein
MFKRFNFCKKCNSIDRSKQTIRFEKNRSYIRPPRPFIVTLASVVVAALVVALAKLVVLADFVVFGFVVFCFFVGFDCFRTTGGGGGGGGGGATCFSSNSSMALRNVYPSHDKDYHKPIK